jgi:cell division septation protein DedD
MLLPRRHALRVTSGLLLGIPMLSACVGVRAGDVVSGEPVATLMIKPRIPTGDADALMRVVRRNLPQPSMARYVRPMSGGAHVVQLTAPATREQVPALIERLRASGDFEYVDIDAPVKIK